MPVYIITNVYNVYTVLYIILVYCVHATRADDTSQHQDCQDRAGRADLGVRGGRRRAREGHGMEFLSLMALTAGPLLGAYNSFKVVKEWSKLLQRARSSGGGVWASRGGGEQQATAAGPTAEPQPRPQSGWCSSRPTAKIPLTCSRTGSFSRS